MTNLDRLPIKLKELRQNHNVTQKQIAEHIGVTSVSVQRFEYGDRRPSLENIIKLCQFFNVSADYLLGLSDNPERQ